VKYSFKEKLMRLVESNLLCSLLLSIFYHWLFPSSWCRWMETQRIVNPHLHIFLLFFLLFPIYLKNLIDNSDNRRVTLPSELAHYFNLNVSEMSFKRSRHLWIKDNKGINQLPKLECMNFKNIQHLCK